MTFSRTKSVNERHHYKKQQPNLGIVLRESDFVAYDQQRCRPACASTKSAQLLCYMLPTKYNI